MMDTRTVTLNADELRELERIHAKKTAERIGGMLFVAGLVIAIGAGLLGFGPTGLGAGLAFGVSAMVALMYSATK